MKDKSRKVPAVCKDCGRSRLVRADGLWEAIKQSCHSCGAKRARAAKNWTKHNGSRTRLYRVWMSMLQRCGNPNNQSARNYLDRGIRVCSEWQGDFVPFRDWALTHGYRQGLAIDRINNNGPYSPGNCRWATAEINCQNSRHTKLNVADVCVIRSLAELGVSCVLLGAFYRINASTISGIKHRKYWKNAEAELCRTEGAAI